MYSNSSSELNWWPWICDTAMLPPTRLNFMQKFASPKVLCRRTTIKPVLKQFICKKSSQEIKNETWTCPVTSQQFEIWSKSKGKFVLQRAKVWYYLKQAVYIFGNSFIYCKMFGQRLIRIYHYTWGSANYCIAIPSYVNRYKQFSRKGGGGRSRPRL